MKVSIIMPTYKRVEYIKNAIGSVLEQSFTDYELIVVDDNIVNSKEHKDTESVIKDFGDPRIRYIKNRQNLGGALSRNVGIDAAKGEYIAFLDDDDMYLPTKLAVQVHAMDAHDWDLCVMDGATYSYETGEKLTERHQQVSVNMTNDELIRIHMISHISGTNSFMFKTDFIRKIGGFENIPSCQEYILMLNALEAKPKFGYIPEIHIKNFMHEGEHLSTGPQKIFGQKVLIERKKKYFYLLSKQEKADVMCRHYGVLFFVNFRLKNYYTASWNAFRCFFSSPKQAYLWFKEYKKKIVG